MQWCKYGVLAKSWSLKWVMLDDDLSGYLTRVKCTKNDIRKNIYM